MENVTGSFIPEPDPALNNIERPLDNFGMNMPDIKSDHPEGGKNYPEKECVEDDKISLGRVFGVSEDQVRKYHVKK